MSRTVAIGIQDYAQIITNDYFYIDKTNFIKEWWECGDAVTLITRPRRFGKTLNMSMLDYFFSNKQPDRAYLFEGLSIWNEEKYRKLQGTYPVISLTFANIKETKESIFSDLNNLKVITTTSDRYATSFGFTEEEVFTSLDECVLAPKKKK